MGALSRQQGILGLLVLVSCWCQLAAAQNYTALRGGLWLPVQSAVDNATAQLELQGLMQKLPQIKGTQAEQQLQFLSTSSRSKLNNLTGSAAEWLRNRTDVQLEELFESIRTENFRRMMAIAAIGTQLQGAMTSSNVLVALEQLQTEDLERLASLPLYEGGYQRLTNVTFLQLMQQIYDFGLTQVTRRTCILTAANTSAIEKLPSADPSSPAGNSGAFSALDTSAPAPVVTYSVVSSGRRRRRSLLSTLTGWDRGWLHLGHDEAAAAVVRAATRGPGSAAHLRRMLLQTPAPAPGTNDNTVAPIVTRFINGLGTNANGATPSTATGTSTGLTASIGSVPGLATRPGFLDSRAVTSGCTENLGLLQLRSSTNRSGARRRRSSSNTTAVPQPLNSTLPAAAAPVSCSAGLLFNGADCVPCPPGTVLDGSICVCANGTVFDANVSTCVPAPCLNGTNPDGTPCGSAPPPCTNGTFPNGTQCSPPPCVNGTNADGTPCLTPPPPCVNGTFPNGTQCGQPSPPPCVNGTNLDGTPCLTPPPPQPPCVNGTFPNGTQCSPPATPPCGLNGTNPDGTPCAYNTPPPPQPPCVNGTFPNGTQCTQQQPRQQPLPCVNGTLTDGVTPCNTTAPLLSPKAPEAAGNSTTGNLTAPPTTNSTISPSIPALNQTAAPPQEYGGNFTANTTSPAVPGSNSNTPATPASPDNSTTGGYAGGSNSSSIVPGVSPPALLPPDAGVGNATSPPVQTPGINSGNGSAAGGSNGGNSSVAGGGSSGGGVGGSTLPTVNSTSPSAPLAPATPPSTGGPAPSPSPSPAMAPASGGSTSNSTAAAPPPGPTPMGPPVLSPAVAPAASSPAPPAPAITPAVPLVTPGASPSPSPAAAVAPPAEIFSPGVFVTTPATVPSPSTAIPPAPSPAPSTGTTPVPTPSPIVVPPPPTPTPVLPSPAPIPVASPATNAPTSPAVAPITTLVQPTAPVLPPSELIVPPAAVAPPTVTPPPPTPAPPQPVPITAPAQLTTPAAGPVAVPVPVPVPPAVAPLAQVVIPPAVKPADVIPQPVNCVGSWVDSGACSATCADVAGTKTSVFTITQQAANGGAACEAAAGAIRQVPCTSPTPCAKPINCVGNWIESGACSATCADIPSTKTSVFTITQQAANGGAACEAAAGATKQVPCTNPTPCAKPINCVGSWAETGACSATCADVPGTKTSVFTITQQAANGGAACEAAAGATKQVPCTNPTPCPKPAVAAPPTVPPPVAAPPTAPPPAAKPATVTPPPAPAPTGKLRPKL